MIISASRRTDIPAYYSEWLLNRLKEGFVLTRNPMNYRQVRKINLSPESVDGIVFWTKNPLPMLTGLDKLSDYMHYFQFSLTPYGRDIEPNLPHKKDVLLTTFKKLAEKIGAKRVIWRYDPILLNSKYTADYHVHAFSDIAGELCGYTEKVIISFIETEYRGVKGNASALALTEFSDRTKTELASALSGIATSHNIIMESCATDLDLSKCNIKRAKCIDGGLFSKLLGHELDIKKDKNQRPACGCASSADIGMYNTCQNGCRYCYANYNPGSISKNVSRHNSLSATLIGEE